MREIDLKIDREEIFGSLGLIEAKVNLDSALDQMTALSAKYPELVEFMKRFIYVRIMLSSVEDRVLLLQHYTKYLEKQLNINQDPPEEYCSDCGRGGS